MQICMKTEAEFRNLSEPVTNVKNGLGIFTAFSYDEVAFYVKNKYRESRHLYEKDQVL